MSKIFKDSDSFIPEKIVPGEIHRPPVWGHNIKEIDSNGDHSSFHGMNQENPGSTGQDVDPNQLSSLNSDFSSPIPDDFQEGSTNLTRDVHIPEIDADAIAEEFFNKGIQEGIKRVQEDYESSIKTLQAICEELNSIRETILHNSSEEMRNLVLLIAEKILRQSLSEQQQTILNTVNEALQRAVKTDEFVISVHPDDLETISANSAEFIKSVNGLEKIIVKADSDIEQGGCFIESSNCTIDATISSQLKIISDALGE